MRVVACEVTSSACCGVCADGAVQCVAVVKKIMLQSGLVEGYWPQAETWGCGLSELTLLQMVSPQSVTPKHTVVNVLQICS